MSKNVILQKDVQKATIQEPLTDAAENSGSHILISRLKKIIFIACLAGTGLFLNGCMAGYVETEPAYVEYARPQRPSELSIWIDGDWYYNGQSRGYVQHTGYWERPRQGQTFVTGHWQSTPRGKTWSKGHWQRQSR
jgi:hypothetical protein